MSAVSDCSGEEVIKDLGYEVGKSINRVEFNLKARPVLKAGSSGSHLTCP